VFEISRIARCGRIERGLHLEQDREPTGLDAIADLVLNRAIGETLGAALGVD
jgi:hypothetical protein